MLSSYAFPVSFTALAGFSAFLPLTPSIKKHTSLPTVLREDAASTGKAMPQSETIVAIATAVVPQQGSVGIVRLSGISAIAIAQQLFHAPGHQPWESHRILYGSGPCAAAPRCAMVK